MKRRLFVAVDLPEDARHRLAAGIDQVLGGRRLPGRGAPPPNWHLTLRFLGWSDEVAMERVTAGLDQAPLGARFSVTISGWGSFPNPRRATVLWLGVSEGGQQLQGLAEEVEQVALTAGYPPEDRPFRSHLTLSRIRPHQDLTPLVEGPSPPPVRFLVEEVTLFESHLSGGGARYQALERFPLG